MRDAAIEGITTPKRRIAAASARPPQQAPLVSEGGEGVERQ